jgi:hypothetical protein
MISIPFMMQAVFVIGNATPVSSYQIAPAWVMPSGILYVDVRRVRSSPETES